MTSSPMKEKSTTDGSIGKARSLILNSQRVTDMHIRHDSSHETIHKWLNRVSIGVGSLNFHPKTRIFLSIYV